MKKLRLDRGKLKALFSCVARGAQLQKTISILFPDINNKSVRNHIYMFHRDEYKEAKLRKREKMRKARASRIRAANKKYYSKESSISKKLDRLHRYRMNPRFREYEKMRCKAYRVSKLLNVSSTEIARSWYPNLLGPRWFGVTYAPFEMSAEELRTSAEAELPVPPHTPLPHIKAR